MLSQIQNNISTQVASFGELLPNLAVKPLALAIGI